MDSLEFTKISLYKSNFELKRNRVVTNNSRNNYINNIDFNNKNIDFITDINVKFLDNNMQTILEIIDSSICN